MSTDKEDHSTLHVLSKPSSVSTSLESIFTPVSNSSTLKSIPVDPILISSTGKRFNSDSPSDLCSSIENKPLSHFSKRQRTKSGPDQMESTTEKQEENHIKVVTVSNNLTPSVNSHNPLSERNIRVENDVTNSFNMSNAYDSSANKNSRLGADVTISNSQGGVTVSNHHHLGNISNNNYGPENNSTSSNVNNRNDSNNPVVDDVNDLGNTSLSSAINSLENSQRSLASSTLDYVARLPDGCSRQLEGFEEPGCTPPQACNSTPVYPCSGDEDDDNYLDSSDEGEDEPDSNTNNDEDESCGEDDGSVVSTVGSTCSLRSVASEALASICRNEQGQTTKLDGSLLYSCSPSQEPLPALSLSLFSNVPPSIKFCEHNENNKPLPEVIAKLLKWRYTPITPLIIRKTVTNSGYKMTKRTMLWSGTWGKHMKSPCFKTVRSYQKVNHFAGTFQIGRKDKLWKNFLRLQAKFGKEEFGFMPKTFILPAEREALKIAFEKEGVKKKWIVKPPASARGTGIQVVDKWSQLDTKTPMIVQRYVSKPYLINNTKFDLRIYVLVTSFNPLRIYLYQDGLVRFASVEYRNESTTLSDRFMHLTNYSVNKSNSSYTHNTEAGQCQGHRWTLCTLWGYLKAHGVDTGALWDRIADMVIKTILSGEHDIIVRNKKNVRSNYSCFELFGVDVLLDEKLRPWLLEVNISPSLHSACSLDYMVKGPLVAQLLTMAAYHVPDHRSLTPSVQAEALSELGLSDSVSRLTLDHRLYTRLLSDAELVKHNTTNRMPRSKYLATIVEPENLTPDDVRHLLLGEDELQRAGKFTCIFPTAETHQYFGFLDNQRYYNRLWDAWENAFGSCRSEGIARLEKLCADKFHLIVPPKFKMPKVVGITLPKPAKKEDTISVTPTGSSLSDGNDVVVTTTISSSSTVSTVSVTSSTSADANTASAESSTPATTVSDDDSGIQTAASTETLSEACASPPSSANAENGVAGSQSSAKRQRPAGQRHTGGVESNCNKRSKIMKSRARRRPRLTVIPGKPLDGCSLLNVNMVVGGRGEGGCLAEEESDGEWEEEEGGDAICCEDGAEELPEEQKGSSALEEAKHCEDIVEERTTCGTTINDTGKNSERESIDISLVNDKS